MPMFNYNPRKRKMGSGSGVSYKKRNPRRIRQTTKELKGIDSTLAGAGTPTTGFIVLLNGVAAGDDINERNGRAILNKYIDVVYKCGTDGSSGVHLNSFRVIFFYDRSPNGVLATVADVLSTASLFSPRRLDTASRFNILYDKVHDSNSTATTEITNGAVTRHVRVNVKNLPSHFTSSSAGIGSIREGSLCVLYISTDSSGLFTMISKSVYVDM